MTPAPLDRRRWLGVSGAALIGLGAFGGLVGCATPPRDPANGRRWSGRLALSIGSDPPQHWSAGFELSGNPEAGELVFLSPLGQVLARLVWTPVDARLERGSEQRRYANAQDLTTDLLGTALPLQPLFQWLAGVDQALAGWSVDLSQHAQGRLRAERLEPTPSATLRIVLDETP